MLERTARTDLPLRRQSLRNWLVGIVLLLGFGIGLFWYFHRQSQKAIEEKQQAEIQKWENRLQQAISDAERLDGPWQIEDLYQRSEGSDSSEGIRIQEEVEKLIPEKWPSWGYPNPESEPIIHVELLRNLYPTTLLTPTQLAEMRREMKRAESAIAVARKFIDEPSGQIAFSFPKDPSKRLGEYPQIGSSSTVLSYDVLFRTQEGDTNGAIESCLAHFNHVSLVGNIPTPYAQDVRRLIRAGAIRELEHVLALGEPSLALLERFQNRLMRESQIPVDLIGERGYRAARDRWFQLMIEGEIPLAEYLERKKTTSEEEVEDWPRYQQITLLEGRTILLEISNHRVEILKLPTQQWAKESPKSHPRFDSLPSLVSRVLSFPGRGNWDLNSLAKIRCAIIGLAIERYRQQQKKWPDNLKDLIPDYLPEILLDPYDGNPLRYQRLEDGVVIYSIGRDLLSGEGYLKRQGLLKDPDDIGFQLWDVKSRRQTQE